MTLRNGDASTRIGLGSTEEGGSGVLIRVLVILFVFVAQPVVKLSKVKFTYATETNLSKYLVPFVAEFISKEDVSKDYETQQIAEIPFGILFRKISFKRYEMGFGGSQGQIGTIKFLAFVKKHFNMFKFQWHIGRIYDLKAEGNSRAFFSAKLFSCNSPVIQIKDHWRLRVFCNSMLA